MPNTKYFLDYPLLRFNLNKKSFKAQKVSKRDTHCELFGRRYYNLDRKACAVENMILIVETIELELYDMPFRRPIMLLSKICGDRFYPNVSLHARESSWVAVSNFTLACS